MIYYDNNTPCLILISLNSTKISAHALAIINGKSVWRQEIPWLTELKRECNICSGDPYLWRST